MRYGRDYGRGRVWMGGGGVREGDSDVEYGYSALGYRGGGGYGGRSYREPERSRGRYAADYRRDPRPPAGYGWGFRRGYEAQGGFGPANERASRRDLQARSGPLRVGPRYGQGYGRG